MYRQPPGLGGDWGGSGYNAAKGAVTNLTRSLALEYAARNVRVNAVAPSLTSTDATADIEKNEAIIRRFAPVCLPVGRHHRTRSRLSLRFWPVMTPASSTG